MPDSITLTGLVATVPRHLVTSEGLPITSFRLASTRRRFDKKQERWVDADTNWFTITVFRQLAINAASSIVKGDRVLVDGRLRIRDWENGERSGTTVEVEADALGHDLMWGSSAFTRSIASSPVTSAEDPGPAASAEGGWAVAAVPEEAEATPVEPDVVGAVAGLGARAEVPF